MDCSKIRWSAWLFSLNLFPFFLSAQALDSSVMHILKTQDFGITGQGNATNWNIPKWTILTPRNKAGTAYQTRIKLLYSDSGIYCLYSCEDSLITSTLKEDFTDLYNEDVVEAFFWTDETVPIYFEYELSPRNYELPILVPNVKGDFLGWLPWHYDGNRKTKHATHINSDGVNLNSWTAEFFIPFALLKPMPNVPPGRGTRWRANFYRIDYDKKVTYWSWQITRTNFHDFERFGSVFFD